MLALWAHFMQELFLVVYSDSCDAFDLAPTDMEVPENKSSMNASRESLAIDQCS